MESSTEQSQWLMVSGIPPCREGHDVETERQLVVARSGWRGVDQQLPTAIQPGPTSGGPTTSGGRRSTSVGLLV